MKEQLVRSGGLVLAAAIFGGCLIVAAKNTVPEYQYVVSTVKAPSGSSVDRVIQIDRQGSAKLLDYGITE